MCSVHTQITKQIQGSKIKTSNSLFHLACLEFFHLMFIPQAKLCILFCHQLAFNLFWILSRSLSTHRWVITAALRPAKRGVSQLRDSLSGLVPNWCGREGGHVSQIRHGTKPWRDTPLTGDVAKLRRLLMSRFKISNMRWGRWLLLPVTKHPEPKQGGKHGPLSIRSLEYG